MQHFSRIPLDVWFALAGAVGLVLMQLIEPAHVFVHRRMIDRGPTVMADKR